MKKNIVSSKTLPNSKIIYALETKSKEKSDEKQNMIFLLESFRLRVSQEISFTNLLFPEYTPHDETYHISRLFTLGDKLLSEDLINGLNASELLLLSIGIYGHDWGMAVSEVEKEYVTTGKVREAIQHEDFFFQEGEPDRFKSFLNNYSFSVEKDITLSIWQEYVRTTHATRSGYRVRKYFEKTDPGLGDAAARVCEGHWLDFKFLQETHNYPINYSINGEVVNLRAIAIYLRLIDLYDITQERTPYVIWKYVSPKDNKSKIEWEKHKAIYSISFPKYQEGRIVQIDGSTDDNFIYSALIDLKNWCDDQLKNSNDILNHINDSKYNLNIFHADWRIQARGFKPISVQFEFDRARMFQVLSDQIYRGDRYVFLRELLQNSIDAINVRREVLAKRGINSSSVGFISVNVKSFENGDSEIIFSDDGVGMDEYIINNYLSIAGKSYYNSSDFMKLGLEMDPISKFGVGVLSCFMVADRIDILTTREPYLTSKSETLKVSIPSVNHQFRIEASSSIESKIGTEFKIFVKGEKLKKKSPVSDDFSLDVTGYMKKLVGFVNVPIRICEDSKCTIITPPGDEGNFWAEKFPNDLIIQNLIEFPWNSTIQPQCLNLMRKDFSEVRIDLKKDLGMDETGTIIYLKPKNQNIWFTNRGNSWPQIDFILSSDLDNNLKGMRVQLMKDYRYFKISGNDSFGNSVATSNIFKVYIDGIILSNAKYPDNFFHRETIVDQRYPLTQSFLTADSFCTPYLVVNFKKSNLREIDLSRSTIVDDKFQWDHLINKKLLEYFRKEFADKSFNELGLKDRLIYLSNFCFLNNISVDKLFDALISVSDCPVWTIQNEGKPLLKEWKELEMKWVYSEPYYFNYFSKNIKKYFTENEVESNPLNNWRGGEFVLTERLDYLDEGAFPCQILIISYFQRYLLSKTHTHYGFRFLGTPWQGGLPMIQSIWVPAKNEMLGEEKLLDKILTKTESIDHEDLVNFFTLLFSDKKTIFHSYEIPTIGAFVGSNESKFSYGFEFLNSKHINSLFIIQALGVYYRLTVLLKENDETVGRLGDLIKALPFFERNSKNDLDGVNTLLLELFNFLISKSLLKNVIKPQNVTIDSFVDKSVVLNSKNVLHAFHDEENMKLLTNMPNYSIVLD